MSSNTESFQLSLGAQNVEAKFYGKIAIVYVEGPDDKIFWSQFFDINKFEIRVKDGCRNLDEIVDEIVHKGLKHIVARDADYSFYDGSLKEHPLLVTTLSHSIECVMYCPINLNNCIHKLARDLEDHVEEIKNEYKLFCNSLKDLLIYDIVNIVYSHGDSILGDSCARFLCSNQSTTLDVKKINSFLKSKKFPMEELDEIRRIMKTDNRCIRQITKGHFQTTFVVNLLKEITSKISGHKCSSISNDALFALLVDCSEKCHKKCFERDFIKTEIDSAISYLR